MNYIKFQNVIESGFDTTLYKTDIYHPYDFRDSNKIFYNVYTYRQSYGELSYVTIETSKILIANRSYRDIHFIFSFDDGYYFYTYNKSNIKDFNIKGDEYTIDTIHLIELLP